MNLILRIPDDLAQRLSAGNVDLERRALEALVADAYRAGRMTKSEVCGVLGFEVLDEFDSFLKAHAVYEDYSPADLERERQALDRFGV
jgi:hypothetical protein